MRFGLGAYALGWSFGLWKGSSLPPMTAGGLIELAASLGFDAVQLADNIPYAKAAPGELDELRRLAESRGVTIEAGARGLTRENLRHQLQVAQRLGSPTLRFVLDEPGYEPDLSAVAAILREAEPEIAVAGCRVAVENHDRFRSRDLRQFVEAVGSPWVGICLDTANSYGAGEDTRRVAEALLPVTFCLHLKDYRVTRLSHSQGFTIAGTALGDGLLRWRELIAEAEKGPCESVILEHWAPPETDDEATRKKEREWCRSGAALLRSYKGASGGGGRLR